MNDVIANMWNYYLILEQDLSDTSRYIEPQNQDDVYSYEFAKIIVLANTEVESVFKTLCKKIDGKEAGTISDYKSIILSKFPKIIDAYVNVPRAQKTIKPYEEWAAGKLSWWDAYQHIKHSRSNHFSKATYKNALLSLCGLYIIIFYLAEFTKTNFLDYKSNYILSPYRRSLLINDAEKHLPDFGDDMHTDKGLYILSDNETEITPKY